MSIAPELDQPSDFSIWALLWSLKTILVFYTVVFAAFEKVNKERFVINQSNQQTRKLLGELINCCCATVTVSVSGKISFFNDAFRSLVLERLQYEELPDNIFSIFEDSPDE